MKCATHPDRDATGYCRTCGKPLCPECTRDVRGALYCEGCLAEHLSAAAGPMPTPSQVTAPSPGLAAVLGFVPGLGAIYNGEYVKGLIHIAIFAGVIAVMNAQTNDSLQVFFGISLACFICYMPIEAYRTAKLKQAAAYGYPSPSVETPMGNAPSAAASSSFAGAAPAAAPQAQQHSLHSPVAGAVVLIALGFLILLSNFGLLSGNWLGRWWPLLLIGFGVWLFWKRNNNRGRNQQR